jgi:glycosyltransferase involved in cell wall biosynthesis
MNFIFVNGRFLGRPMTGVERFADMILQAVDRMPEALDLGRWRILAPQGVERPAWLKNIEFENTGSRNGHAWEQMDLLRASRSGMLVNLCNSAPVFHSRQLTVIHDASVYRHPEYFSPAYGLLHRTLGRLIARKASIATVSNFSKTELSQVLHIPFEEIAVIPNAADHTGDIEPDASVLTKLDLDDRPFFLFVGSPAPNKNLIRAILAFRELARADYRFVIVGAAAKSFAASGLDPLPANVIRTGRLTDAEIKALYARAKALIFPSIYEGFGIPPLEAMKTGCLTAAADIPPVREVCADAAVYFNPLDVPAITATLQQIADDKIDRQALIEAGIRRSREYSWDRSAASLIEAVGSLARKAS